MDMYDGGDSDRQRWAATDCLYYRIQPSKRTVILDFVWILGWSDSEVYISGVLGKQISDFSIVLSQMIAPRDTECSEFVVWSWAAVDL